MHEERCPHPANQADELITDFSVATPKPADMSSVRPGQPFPDRWAVAEEQDAANLSRSGEGLPWGQLAVFLIVFLVFASIVLAWSP